MDFVLSLLWSLNKLERETRSKHDALIKFLWVFVCCLCCFWSVGSVNSFNFQTAFVRCEVKFTLPKSYARNRKYKMATELLFLKCIRNSVLDKLSLAEPPFQRCKWSRGSEQKDWFLFTVVLSCDWWRPVARLMSLCEGFLPPLLCSVDQVRTVGLDFNHLFNSWWSHAAGTYRPDLVIFLTKLFNP